MNIHEKVERLTKELDDQYKLLNEIKKQLEPEITEGQYVFIDGFQELHRVVEFDSVDNTYGVVPISDKDNGSWEKRDSLRIACDKEVEQALIKEAKRRYSVGDLIRTVTNSPPAPTVELHKTEYFRYNTELDELWWGRAYDSESSYRIYKQGEFAEIIEDEWEVKQYDLPGNQYYVSNGNREIDGVMESLSKKEAQAIANALNNLGND